ncbi:MAG: hypothetical protein V8Q32_00195 [Anaerotignum faecicola]
MEELADFVAEELKRSRKTKLWKKQQLNLKLFPKKLLYRKSL